MALARQLDHVGIGVTLAYWDGPADDPRHIEAELGACVDALAALRGTPRLSVKAPPLGFDSSIVTRLADRAAAAGVGLVLDAHGPEHADATLALARVAVAAGADTGVAVPARWQRSAEDARAALADGLRVRIVKGQWQDDALPGEVENDAALRQDFLRLASGLPDATDRIGVATHDPRVLAALTAPGRRRFFGELELLFGMPSRRVLTTAARCGVPVRYYLPYGHATLGFDWRELRRRPRLGVALAEGVLLGRANRRLRAAELDRSGLVGR
jgi:proline dehydrogenase